MDILAGIQYSCINKSSCLVFSWVLSVLPVQLPMPSCFPLIAAILMQKFSGCVKLPCPKNWCRIMRRLKNWKTQRPASYRLSNNLYHYIFSRLANSRLSPKNRKKLKNTKKIIKTERRRNKLCHCMPILAIRPLPLPGSGSDIPSK